MIPTEKSKTILLVAPNDYELYKLIQKNLEFHGFKVTTILSNPIGVKYKNWNEKISSFIKKTFFNDKKFKQKLINRNILSYQINQLSEINNYDYSLFIRADFFDDELIKLVKQKVKRLVSYHYDGLKRSPDIFKKIQLFDNFYVFQKNDLTSSSDQLLPCTNFYFDYDLEKETGSEETVDFYFLGSHHDSRFKDLIAFKEMCIKHNYTFDFQIMLNKLNISKKDIYTDNFFTHLDKILPFESYIENIKKSKIIVDFVIDEHLGLSFRTFESIKYQKKLITTNPTIVNYDFYNPNNIYLINNNSFENIENFINTDYIPLPNDIIEKYSFKNWINYILEINPSQNLIIP